MKKILFICFIGIINSTLFSQIPNSSFEIWDSVGTYENPRGWDVNQNENQLRFEKDVDAIDGNYALKVFSNETDAFSGCKSIARTYFKVSETFQDSQSLYFHVKVDGPGNFNNVITQVFGSIYNDTVKLGSYKWETYEKILDYTQIQIPLDYLDFDSLTINVVGGAWNSTTDDCTAQTISWLDKFEIGDKSDLTGSYELKFKGVDVFPNPSNGQFSVRDESNVFNTFEIYNLLGERVSSGLLSKQDIQIEKRGVFILCLSHTEYTDRKWFTRIVVQ